MCSVPQFVLITGCARETPPSNIGKQLSSKTAAITGGAGNGVGRTQPPAMFNDAVASVVDAISESKELEFVAAIDVARGPPR